MRVFGWAADSAGCGWYRMQMPLDELAKHGHETLVDSVMPEEWRDTADVIVGQRVCKGAPSRVWQELAASKNRPLLVFEVDDNLFEVDASSPVAHEWFNRPQVQANLRSNAAVADVVTVSTEPLAEVMRRINPNVRVVPNMVPAALLDLPDVRRTDGVVTVGWAGSSTHAMDFADVASELVRFFPRNPGTEYHSIGGLFPSMQGLSAKHVRISGWRHDIWDYYRGIDFHVALAPLRPHVFNRSKSPVKAIEMAARGIPIVASDTGPYPEFVRHGVTGFLPSRPHEWPKYLRELVNDQAMRDEMGAAALALAAEHTIEGGWQRWEEALQP